MLFLYDNLILKSLLNRIRAQFSGKKYKIKCNYFGTFLIKIYFSTQ